MEQLPTTYSYEPISNSKFLISKFCPVHLFVVSLFLMKFKTKTQVQIQKIVAKNCVSGTRGCGGHVGVRDIWVSGTCGCQGHVGVGNKWVGDMCAGGQVDVEDMWVWETFVCWGLVFWGTCVPDSMDRK